MKPTAREEVSATRPASPSVALIPREPGSEGSGSARLDVLGFRLAGSSDPRQRYELLAEHGRGGLGRVSRAHDRELQREVAIKELVSRNEVNERRFMREALLTARLEHPGIVPVHEAGRWADGTPFYAMKLIAGRPLRELIAERRTVPERLGLLHHVIAVADAIAYAHGQKVIHRDLKPSNIIVGDFGETMVIDWGLAKNLSDADDVASCDPGSDPGDDELTRDGTVLGTPAYMAPEQARGERVDARADVFAIGAMLWELCSLDRGPAPERGERHRQLRRNGIDEDLIAIIDKATHPLAARRYADAGALAADLKAFKAGARIASRAYSPVAVIKHWIRRHRAIAWAGSGVAALAIVGAIAYVRSIAAERDLVQAALQHVEAAQSELVLEHAALLLRSDPTAAVAALATYHGGDRTRARQLAAEAAGRGVARTVAAGHSDTIYLLGGMRDGAILSVGEDRLIRVTKDGAVTTLASDYAVPGPRRYASRTQLLAYASTETGVVLLDVAARRAVRLSSVRPEAIAFSADGARVAVLAQDQALTIWDTATPPRVVLQRPLEGGLGLSFVGTDRLIVATHDGFVTISLTGAAEPALTIAASGHDASPEYFAVGDGHGVVSVFDTRTFRLLSAGTVCRESVSDVRVLASRSVVAFACHEGSAGVASWLPKLEVRERFATSGAAIDVRASTDETLVLVASDSNTLYVHDVDHRTTAHYDGHPGKLSYVSAPTADYAGILTGDVNGAIRAWDAPRAAARVVLQHASDVSSAAISPDGNTVAASAADGAVMLASLRGSPAIESHGHGDFVQGVRFTSDGRSVLSFGYDGKICVWDARTLVMTASMAEHHSRVERVDLIDHEHQVVSVGDDGRLLSWRPDSGAVTPLFTTRAPLVFLQVLAPDDTMVIGDALGSVWHVRDATTARLIRAADDDRVTMLRASRDGRLVAIGTSAGEVTIFETSTWQRRTTLRVEGSIRQVMFSPDGSRLVIASEAPHLRLVHLSGPGEDRWQDSSLDIRDAAFSPDGKLLGMVSRAGGTWFYAFGDDSWTYADDHRASASFGRFSSDGHAFISTDSEGSVVLRELRR